jgi:hypothetical protein
MISLESYILFVRLFLGLAAVPKERSEPPLVVTTGLQRQLLPPTEHTLLPHIYPGQKIE